MKQPPKSTMRRIVAPLAAVVVLAVAAWLFISSQRAPAETPPLAGAPIGGDFTLVDQNGRTVTNDSLKGRYRLVYFGYSFCPDVCPVDVQRMAQALKAFEASDPKRAAKVQPVFITVDPARDTPEALKMFVSAFHPRLLGLTGSQAQVDQAKKAYRVYAARSAGTDDENYLMDHSAYIYLMDPAGHPIDFYQRSDSIEAMVASLDKWVR